MQDTPEHIKQLQHEMYMSRSQEERLKMGFEMIDEVDKMIWINIRNQYPNISETEQKIIFFNRIYEGEISEQLRKDFIENLKQKEFKANKY